MKPKDLLKHFKTKAAIARAFDVTPQSINDWFNADRVPIPRQYQAEVLTGFRLRVDKSIRPSKGA